MWMTTLLSYVSLLGTGGASYGAASMRSSLVPELRIIQPYKHLPMTISLRGHQLLVGIDQLVNDELHVLVILGKILEPMKSFRIWDSSA